MGKLQISKKFESDAFNHAYIEIRTDYESLINSMRLFWEEHRRNMNSYSEMFVGEFSTKHTDALGKWISLMLGALNLGKVSEVEKFRTEIDKII